MAISPEERHPIEVNPPGIDDKQRIHILECALAELWDQVWWLSLTPEARAAYEAQGFAAPIQKFYGRSV
jgi:hypothetical protein